MKRVEKKGMNGKTVTVLEAENEKDAAELRRMVEDKKLDGRISFGDMRAEVEKKK